MIPKTIYDRWAEHQRAEGKSERTIGERRRTVRVLRDRMGVLPPAASAADVIAFMATFQLKAPCTRATYFGHLNAWFEWLITDGHRDDNPCAKLKTPKFRRRRPWPVNDAQFGELLHTPMRRRTRTMILLAAFQGLRAHEIAKIRGEDINLSDGTLRVIGKGQVDAFLPLHPTIRTEAACYPRHGYWFTTYTGNHVANGHVLAHSVTGVVSRAMSRAGIDGGIHRLRHRYASQLVLMGVNLRVVQELLRHASLQTTQIYTEVTLEQQRSAIELLPAIAAFDGAAA